MLVVPNLRKSLSHKRFVETVMTSEGKVKKVGEGKFGARIVTFSGGVQAALKPKLHSNEMFNGIPKDTQHLREAAAYQLDWKLLHFDIVPPTTLTMYDGKQASIQHWVTGHKPHQIVPHVFDKSRNDWKKRVALFAARVDTNALRKVCIFDLITNNTDRHAKNCEFDPFLKRIWAIDNGLAFGRHFQHYYNVFHRFLFRKNLILKPEEVTRLRAITREQLKKTLERYLRPRDIEETYLRIQWILGHPNLGFEMLSQKEEGKADFPSRKKWFQLQMKKEPKNKMLARIAEMGGLAAPEGLT